MTETVNEAFYDIGGYTFRFIYNLDTKDVWLQDSNGYPTIPNKYPNSLASFSMSNAHLDASSAGYENMNDIIARFLAWANSMIKAFLSDNAPVIVDPDVPPVEVISIDDQIIAAISSFTVSGDTLV